MKLTFQDISRIIRACKVYQDQTGSDYIWDEYEHLIEKLNYYQEENCLEEHV